MLEGMEIERKFLIDHVPAGVLGAPWTRLRQGYLVVGDDGEARVRDDAGTYTLTVKSTGGLARSETEVGLSSEQWESLWLATEGRRIEKRRYRVPDEQGVIELDVYEGDLTGLVVAEVEFASLERAAQFRPPTWFDIEVTEDSRYRNASLALFGRPADTEGASQA